MGSPDTVDAGSPDTAGANRRSSDTAGPAQILHVLPQFPYFGGRKVVGGYPSLVLSMADAQIARNGTSVRILSRTLPDGPTTTDSGAQLVSVGSVGTSTGSILGSLWFALKASRRIRQLRSPDLICHIHAGYAEYLIIAILASRFRLRRVVATLYCPVSERPSRRRIQHALLRRAAKRATLTGVSNNVADSMRAALRGTATATVHHLPPLIDIDYFCPRAPADHTPPPGEPTKLIFVGNTSPEKGLHDLLHAFAELTTTHPDVTLTVTTELKRTSSGQRVADTAKLADELGITDRCTFLGVVDNMRDLLRDHHVQVAPFRTTQGPSDYFVATLEAMACGLIAVASDLPGMREVITDGDNGFLARPGDPADLHTALQRAVKATDDQAMSERSRATVVSLFAPDNALPGWNDLYWSTR